MKTLSRYSRLLLGLHLFVMCVWLYLCSEEYNRPYWMFHIVVWSILGIQFTWGLTVGLIVGPNKKRRSRLWWSLLPLFLPLMFAVPLVQVMHIIQGPLIALCYLALFTMILASETFCGVLLGAKWHSNLVSD